jgi:hypothetical protein
MCRCYIRLIRFIGISNLGTWDQWTCTLTVRARQSIITHSWSWALFEKPPVVQLLKKFPAFYGTRRFITVFTRNLYWSLSWARSIQYMLSYPILLISTLILSTHLRLGLPSGILPSGFPTNIVYAVLVPPFVLHALSITSSFTWSF